MGNNYFCTFLKTPKSMNNIIHVAIVEDHDIIRDSLSLLISGTAGYKCIGVFETAEDALRQLPSICPDVVLMDIGLPGMSGIECVKQLKPLCPNTQFLMCTIFENDENIFEAIKAGASGYILKKTPPAQMLQAISELHQGGAPMSGQIARRVLEAMQTPKVHDDMALLTDREKEILQLLAQGFRYKEIAEKLSISTETVRTHVHKIYEKLHVQSRTDAVNKIYGKK